MADTKYSALTLTTPTGSDKFAIAQTGTSFAATVSSVVAAGSTQITAVVTSNTADQGILFNNAGVVSSDSKFLYHYSTQVLDLIGTSSQVFLKAVVAQPTSTAASTIAFYNRAILGGYNRPSFVSYLGSERPLQTSLFDDSTFWWYPTTSSPGRCMGGDSFDREAAYSTALPTVGNAYTTKRRGVYKTSSTAANSTAGMGGESNMYFQGSTSGYGGYLFTCRFGFDTYATSVRFFVGLTDKSSSAICTSDPTGMLNSVGFACNAANSTWIFYHASTGAGTSESFTGQTGFASGNGYDAYIYAPPNTTVIYYRLDELNTGSTVVNSSVSNHLPNSTAYMKPVAMCGALNISTGAGAIGVIKMYCETDI